MDGKGIKNLGMASPAAYQVTVAGLVAEHWTEWFDTEVVELVLEEQPHTRLICNVRDQAELLGILNHLNRFNHPLLQVTCLCVPSLAQRSYPKD